MHPSSRRALLAFVAGATLLAAAAPVDRAESQPARKPAVTVYKTPT